MSARLLEQIQKAILVVLEDTESVQLSLELEGFRTVQCGLLEELFDSPLVFDVRLE